MTAPANGVAALHYIHTLQVGPGNFFFLDSWRKCIAFSFQTAISLTESLLFFFLFPYWAWDWFIIDFLFWLFCWEAGWEDGASSCSGCLGVLGVLARLPSRLAQPSGHALLWAAAGGWWGCRGWAREATDALNDLAWWDGEGLGARLASETKQFFSDMWAKVWTLSGSRKTIEKKKQSCKHRQFVKVTRIDFCYICNFALFPPLI